MNVEKVRTILERTFQMPVKESDAQFVLNRLNELLLAEYLAGDEKCYLLDLPPVLCGALPIEERSVKNNFVRPVPKDDCQCGFCRGLMPTCRPGCPNCSHTLNGWIETTEKTKQKVTLCPYCGLLIHLTDGDCGIV